MPAYPHFVPFLSPAPPPGYQLAQVLPLEDIKSVLDRNDATLDILREVIFEKKIVKSDRSTIVLKGGYWMDDESGGFFLDPVEGSEWDENDSVAFLQTTVTARDAFFSQLREPGFYTIYSGPNRKSFLSDSSQKYAHPAVRELVQCGADMKQITEKERNLLYLIHIASSWSGAILIGIGLLFPVVNELTFYGVALKVLGHCTGLVRARSTPYKVWGICHIGGIAIWLAILIGVLLR